jgi:hypothetical protein
LTRSECAGATREEKAEGRGRGKGGARIEKRRIQHGQARTSAERGDKRQLEASNVFINWLVWTT